MISTPRLRIRRFTADDAPFVLRLLNEPSFIENIADRGVRTTEQAVKYLKEGPIASYAKHGLGLMLVEKTGAPIGMCGLIRRPGQPDVDLGYAYVPEAWGQGYAGEAAEAMLEIARRDFRLPRVAAFVSPGNDRSLRVLARLGFEPAGKTRLNPADPEVLLYMKTFHTLAP
ncbi:MAG TPA: GNAT family N-acetyltransferase [Myxococcales bacterium]